VARSRIVMRPGGERRAFVVGDDLDGNRPNHRFVSGLVATLTLGHGLAVPTSMAKT